MRRSLHISGKRLESREKIRTVNKCDVTGAKIKNTETEQNMGMTWTDDQRKVIELRDRNILVSAAAGSGKTAVLVERIIKIITDKEHPVDIDRLLIVTFIQCGCGRDA